VERLLGPGDLQGKKILIISGSTAEKVDPIRILTNRASGKTGIELGLEAYRRGAEVAIIHRWKLGLPFKEVYAESAREFLDSAIQELSKGYDALISSAAIADYTLDPYEQKIKSGQDLTLKLKPTAKVVKVVRSSYPDLKIVGFKAETNVPEEELILRAKRSMWISGLNLMVANDVGHGGMGSDENRVLIIDAHEVKKADGKKSIIARKVMDALAAILDASDISRV
jgi:phosphopantothenoylcysteine decarboxylase/phosphopantothenate--cysteine ligase